MRNLAKDRWQLFGDRRSWRRCHYIYPELRHGFWKCWDKLSLLLSTLWATEQLKLLRIFFQDSCRSSGYIVTTSEPSVFSTHLHSLAATLMESENSSFIDKIWSQPPLAVATQQGRKDVIKACVALSFDMISMMRIFTRKSTPLERSRIRQGIRY